MADFETEVSVLRAELNNSKIQVAKLENEINSIYKSRSWKVVLLIKKCKKVIKFILRVFTPKQIRAMIKLFRSEGFKGLKRKFNEQKGILPEHNFIPVPYETLKFIDFENVEIPYFDSPLVSIIIPVYNQFGYTYACVRSILNVVKNIPYEIIIGDDLSTDATKDIQKIFPGIIVNKNFTDHGFLVNCNRASKLARGKYIVFLNNDTQVQKNWLSSLLKLIESDEKIGMVGSKLVYQNGILQEAGGIIWNDGNGWNYGRGKDPAMPEYNYVREVDYISGASIMIRTSLWNEIGGFDELFKPAYYEDADLAFEVRKHGYKVMYQPDSVVTHFEGVSNGTDLNSGLKKYQVENRKKFCAKWAETLKEQYKNGECIFKARERNFNKKVIVVLDQYVPTFDKDAGSRTTYLYLKMFLQKEYIVKFIGDNYANKEMEPYSSILRQMGIEYLYGTWYRNNIFSWIKANENSIDFFYMNRPHISEKYINFVKKCTKIKVIYYGHDLHFLRTKREAEVTRNSAELKKSKNWKKRELAVIHKADVVYYPSSVEVRIIKNIDKNVNVKSINPYVFDANKLSTSYKATEKNNILFVGGFGHAPNIDAVKWFSTDIFPLIKAKIPNIKFYIVGSNAPDEIINLNGNGIVFKGFVTDEELEQLYKSIKIVVVPLRYGAGVKGKVIEALSKGCPLVTTSIGTEGIYGIQDVALIKDSAKDFANAVIDLYQDDEQLEKYSKSSVNFVKQNFSLDAAWNIIKDDFQ